MPEKLIVNDPFPDIELALTDGTTMAFPGQAPTLYTALLFYRGAW